MACPPCVSAGVRIPCEDCDRYFRNQMCFDNHKTKRGNKKAVCDRKRNCRSFGAPVLHDCKHECGKLYCETCKANRKLGHLCYMQPLKDVLPPSERVLYVLYEFETTPNTRYSDTVTLHVLYLVCIQHFCSRCESTMSDKIVRNAVRDNTRFGRIR
jgi:hypothetical protein